jgi:Tol biopolymer transport system component
MTTDDRFGTTLSSWLHEDAAHRVPDHLAETLARTAATRQRPWWSSLERLLPMDLSTPQRPFVAVGRLGPFALLIVVALLAVALVVAAIGSRGPSLEPFGAARNGTWVTSANGDIYAGDALGSPLAALVGGDEQFDFSPVWSRDGSRIAFLRSDGPITEPAVLTLMVMDADGTGLRAVTPPRVSLDWFDWSPEGDRIAYVATGDLWVTDTATGAETSLVTDGRVHFPTWLPPEGKEIIVRTETSSPSVLAIAADGSGSRTLSRTPANNRFDYSALAVAPDGSAVTFTRWSESGLPRVMRLDVSSGEVRTYPLGEGLGQRGTAPFSPDGSLVAYAQIYSDASFQIVTANADGSGTPRPLGRREPAPANGSQVDATWAFTPDGASLVVRYGTDEDGVTELVPLDGTASTPIGSGAFNFVDVQRRLP